MRHRVLARLLLGLPLSALLAMLALLGVVGLGTVPPAAALPGVEGRLAGPGPGTGNWPLAGRPQLAAGFKPPATRYGKGHRGVDLVGQEGDAVLAAAPGRVIFAGSVAGIGVVVVDHGSVRTTYQPVRASVVVGAAVGRGDPIGRLTSGGHCPPGACLHWGLLQGEHYLDPLLLIGSGAGPLRLVPAGERAAAQRRAQQRAAAARALATAGPDPVPAPGTAGSPGLLRPVPGPVTSPFGQRFHPILHVWKLHDGLDLGASCGTPLRAPADGVVVARYPNPGYGNRLLIDHGRVGGRHVVTGLNHAQGYRVSVGQRVRKGEVVGTVGATGYATGCHLHLMLWLDGRLTDPAGWFR